jgi:SAM-dependent methyltransferase
MSKQKIASDWWVKKSKSVNETENRFDLTAHHHGREKHEVESRRIIEMGLINPSHNILDLACGAGRLCEFLSGYVQNIIGIDISEYYINFLNKWKTDNKVDNAKFYKADLITSDIYDLTGLFFDVVLFLGTSQVILDDADLKQIFIKIAKSLKSRGKFLLKQTTSIVDDNVEVDTILSGERYITKYRTVNNINKIAFEAGFMNILCEEVYSEKNIGKIYKEIEPWDNTRQMFFLFTKRQDPHSHSEQSK